VAPGLTAITFAANQTSKTITVSTYTDTAVEGTEYFFLNLYKTQADANTNAYATYSTAYIQDAVNTDYSYSVTSSANSATTAVTEGGNVTFTITRSASGSASTVYVATAAGTASGSAFDYTAPGLLTVSFAASEVSKTVTVATLTDKLIEGSEYFYLDSAPFSYRVPVAS
jgi:hypothetical protein